MRWLRLIHDKPNSSFTHNTRNDFESMVDLQYQLIARNS